MIRIALFLLLAVSSAMFLSGCCGTAAQSGEGDAAVATAGWESAGGEPASLTPLTPVANTSLGAQDVELEALRRSNSNLMVKVADLMSDVDRLDAGRAAAASQPVEVAVAPAPVPAAPEITVAGVKEILHGESVNDLPVTMNPRGDVLITLPGSISFGSGKADLKATAQSRLEKLVQALVVNFPDLRIRAEGHTDSDPIRKSKWASNQELSEARAGAVEKYLTRLPELNDAAVSSVGFGATRPVSSNATRAGKAQNRRVELVLTQ